MGTFEYLKPLVSWGFLVRVKQCSSVGLVFLKRRPLKTQTVGRPELLGVVSGGLPPHLAPVLDDVGY